MDPLPPKLSRRKILKDAALLAAGVSALGCTRASGEEKNKDCENSLLEIGKRHRDSVSIRERAAKMGVRGHGVWRTPQDGDPRITQFTKALRRDRLSTDDPNLATQDGFRALKDALDAAYRRTFTRDGFPNSPDFQNIENLEAHIGEVGETQKFQLTNPLGGFSFDLEGTDPAFSKMPDYPKFGSDQTGAEMAELYWMALLRDVEMGFLDEKPAALSQDVADAIANLNRFAWYSSAEGPGRLTQNTFLRARLPKHKGGFKGVEIGPYVSQFLLRGSLNAEQSGTVSFGSLRLSQKQQTVEKRNFLSNPVPGAKDIVSIPGTSPTREIDDWFEVQNGRRSNIGEDVFQRKMGGIDPMGDLLFLNTLRDGANYVHFDQIYQEYLIAASILLSEIPKTGATITKKTAATSSPPPESAKNQEDAKAQQDGGEMPPASPFRAEHGVGAALLLNVGNPYRTAKAQVGFATFGVTHILTLLAEISTRAHKAGWYHKWRLRRIRPEEYAARIDSNLKTNTPTDYNLPNELVSGHKPGGVAENLLNKVKDLNGGKSFLLPQAFPEGCPTHPAYPSGHATVAGASVTVLKALFNEEAELCNEISNPFRVVDGGRSLGFYNEHKTTILTVGGELNKLASNIIYFRTAAGVHWTSDNIEGLLLGERVAVELLMEQTVSSGRTCHAPFYRERISNSEYADLYGGSPFFRVTLFCGATIDIHDGKITYLGNCDKVMIEGVPAGRVLSYEEFETVFYELD